MVYGIDVSFCESPDILRALNIIKTLVELACYAIPFIIIFVLSTQFVSAAKGTNPVEDMKKTAKGAIYRIALGVFVFLIPGLLSQFLTLFIDDFSNNDNYLTCFNNIENIDYFQELYDAKKEQALKNYQDEMKARAEANKKIEEEYAKKVAAQKKEAEANQSSSSSSSSSSGTSSSSSETSIGQKYNNLSDSEIQKIALMCEREQGSSEAGVKAEATLMANRYDMYGSKYSNVYSYVTQSGWFGTSGVSGTPSSASVSYVKDVLINGNRTMPLYIDEHDCWFCNKKKYCSNGLKGDICYLETNGSQSTNVSDRSQYKQDQTVIHNVYTSVYTFYTFPTSTSDPFGYTATAYKKIKG